MDSDPIRRPRDASPMRPDAPRDEIVESLRRLAELIHRNLPGRLLANRVLLPWEATAPLLLARIARQGETLALLIDRGHELDAEMVMRSLLEHLTLFAWLAIEPDDASRPWLAKNPTENTEWWMVTQFKHEKSVTQNQAQYLPGVLDARMRRGLRQMTDYVKTLPTRGEFPSVLKQAEEVDLHWAPRLAGWQTAGPGDAAFAITFRGHYWTLYRRGSSSVHPDYAAIRRFLTPPTSTGYQRHRLGREAPAGEVNVFVSITAFLIADAVAVADAALGWHAYDEALRILERWDEVRAPDLLLAGARLLLGSRRRR